MEKKKRIVTKVGFVYEVPGSETEKHYMQFIMIDPDLLGSDLVRVFKTRYPIDAKPDLEEVVNDDVAFYMHTVIKWGVESGLFFKAGKSLNLGLDKMRREVTFVSTTRCSNIIFDVDKEVWFLWKPGYDSFYYNGALHEDIRLQLTPGSVHPAIDVIKRLDNYDEEMELLWKVKYQIQSDQIKFQEMQDKLITSWLEKVGTGEINDIEGITDSYKSRVPYSKIYTENPLGSFFPTYQNSDTSNWKNRVNRYILYARDKYFKH